MSFFTSIASGIIAGGAKALLGGGSSKQQALPQAKPTVSRTRGVRHIESTEARGRPTPVEAPSSTLSIQRLIASHETLMEAFDVDKGAVTGKSGTFKI